VRGAARFAAFQLHKSVGITILLLVALRLVWRWYRTPPPAVVTGWQRVLAHGVHLAFYVLLFAIPLSGWAIVSSSRTVVSTLLYGVVPWPNLPLAGLAAEAKSAWHGAAEFIHGNLWWVVLVLFALHLAGALKHQWIDRDGELARMAPGVGRRILEPRLLLILLGIVGAAALAWQMRFAPSAPAPARIAAVAQPVAAASPETAPAQPPAAAEAAAPVAPVAKPALSSSWTIARTSTLRFRTTWTGSAIDGGFQRFGGRIVFDPAALDKARVTIDIDTASVFSGDSQRDETLKGEDWFGVASHAKSVFRADRFRRLGEGRYRATGTLTLKGVTLPITFPFTLRIDGDRATMRGTATLDRTAYKIGAGDYAATTDIPAAVTVDIAVDARRKP
jgi:polyisoprenoid-binding protein YceI/cytochrome b561